MSYLERAITDGHAKLTGEGKQQKILYVAVMRICSDEFPAQMRPLLVRARGKWTMPLIIKMLAHFKVPFSILHDADSPKRRDGSLNGSWTANTELHTEIGEARKVGVRVIHRISVPNFEYVHLPVQRTNAGSLHQISNDDKPWNINKAIMENEQIRDSIKALLNDLLFSTAKEEPFNGPFEQGLQNAIKSWVAANGVTDDRYKFV